MHKLSAPWKGPFIVFEVVSPSTYRRQWADGQGVPNVWNIEHLSLLSLEDLYQNKAMYSPHL
jgi:Uma2 family endonuclease